MGEVNEDKDRLYKLCGLQFKLLSHAMRDFPSAKKIVYSTCSLYQEENERVGRFDFLSFVMSKTDLTTFQSFPKPDY